MTELELPFSLWDSDLLAKNCKFCPPAHLAPSFGVTLFEFMEKLYCSWNWSLPGSWQWRFGDLSLHRFWLIHPYDRQMDGQNCDG